MMKKITSIFVMMLVSLPILSVTAIDDQTPTIPIITGSCDAKLGETCSYTVESTDPQGDDIYYEYKFSDDPGAIIESGPHISGSTFTFTHCWCDFYQKTNPAIIRIRAKDTGNHESEWGRFEINLTNLKIKNNFINPHITIVQVLAEFFEYFLPSLNFLEYVQSIIETK